MSAHEEAKTPQDRRRCPFCGCSPPITCPTASAVDTLREQTNELLTACKFFMGALADGDLVRDISHDNDPNWTLKMMKFVSNLSQAESAIAKAEGRLSAQ